MLDRETAQQCVNRLNAKLDDHCEGLITSEQLMIQTWDDLYNICRHYENLIKMLKNKQDQQWVKLL